MVSACATSYVLSIEAQVLQRAKELTESYCNESSTHGCAFVVRPEQGGWVVAADPIYYARDGQRIYGIDTVRFVLFDSDGRFKRIVHVP